MHTTKLNEDSKHESLKEQAGMPNVLSCYRDHANSVQCKRGLLYIASFPNYAACTDQALQRHFFSIFNIIFYVCPST